MPLFRYLLLTVFSLVGHFLWSQEVLQTSGTTKGVRYDASGRPIGVNTTTGKDSLQHRDPLADSVTISFRYFDSTRQMKLDSSVINLHRIVPQPYNYLYLGNLGSAARPILFSPRMYAGFDPGFHSFDLYQYKLTDTRFFQTTRPYSEIAYVLGPSAEQTINLLFTSNFKPTYNFTFEYRFVSAPGLFKSSKNSNHSIRFAIPFTSKNRRYSGNLVYIANRVSAGENGGIVSKDLLNDPRFDDRYLVYTRLGGDASYSSNIFSTTSNATNTFYRVNQVYFRHQYDLGQTDSLQTDSGYVKIFYPRFRVQHNFSFTASTYRFNDPVTADSVYKYYGYRSLTSPLQFQDQWTDLKNELALLAFPEKNNQNQFLKLGAGYQFLNGKLDSTNLQLYNIYLLGEYRNRTRNQRWDLIASAQLYSVGFNAGDYMAEIRAQANLKKFGSVLLGFQNSNRTPGFVFDNRSSFPLLPNNFNLKKENITHLYANLQEPKFGFDVSGHYYILANYTYFRSYFSPVQEGTLVSALVLIAKKNFKLTKHWHLYSEFDFQQPTADAIHLPLFFTHHQLAYEGNFFRNLDLSTGIEVRYFSPFKADDYSPLTGQFFWQDTATISNRPDVAAFMHMRIKSFKLFIRLENLNTISFSNGFGFTHNNFAAPNYPTPGQFLRFGFRWSFVN